MKAENKKDMPRVACCTRRQKVWGIIALAGLFACGWLVGASIDRATHTPIPDAQATETQPEPMQDPVNIVSNSASQNVTRPCEIVENSLESRMRNGWVSEDQKIEIYYLLAEEGCPENSAEYRAQIEGLTRARELIEHIDSYVAPGAATTCAKIEDELLPSIFTGGYDTNSHINNAKIYANLSERGCPENKDKYVALAKQELELARALEDDNLSEPEAIAVVDTYKRLRMQAAAEEVITKVKKLTDPTIEFIIQLEKIINE